jgi:hypothetical protein
MRERVPLEDLHIDEITLKWILKKPDERRYTGLI